MHVVSDIQNSQLSGWICSQYQIFRIAGYPAGYAVSGIQKSRISGWPIYISHFFHILGQCWLGILFPKPHSLSKHKSSIPGKSGVPSPTQGIISHRGGLLYLKSHNSPTTPLPPLPPFSPFPECVSWRKILCPKKHLILNMNILVCPYSVSLPC